MSEPETAEPDVEPDPAPEADPGPEAEPETGAEAAESGPGDEPASEAVESPESAEAGAKTGPDAAAASDSDEPVSVEAERDAYLADLQRVTAEFANFRRQTIRRNAELVAQAAARLAEALLPVLDACEAAVRQEVEGMEPVRSQLVGVLAGQGLEVIDGTGEPFDPNRHEAVMTAGPDEDSQAAVAEPAVVEILRTGYAWKGRVLRPAMVKVAGPGAGG